MYLNNYIYIYLKQNMTGLQLNIFRFSQLSKVV